MKYLALLSGIFLLAALLFSCATKAIPLEKLSSTEAVVQKAEVTARAAWQVEWDETLREARKEGKVVLMSTNSPAVRAAVIQGFKNSTGLELDVITGRGAELSQKLLAERRAGLYSIDAYLGGGTTLASQIKPAGALDPLKPLLFLPEVTDPGAWYQGSLPWFDNENMYVVFPLSNPSGGTDIVFNKNLIKFEPIVSYYDLLDQKLKRKMVLQDPTTAGRGNTWFFWALYIDGMDMEYMKALASQEPIITRNERDMLDGVSKGKYLVAIAPDVSLTRDYMEIGVPLEGRAFKESKPKIAPHSGYIALLKNAPHPRAAKIFTNWYLSKEGQTFFGRSYPTQSARVDVPSDHLRLEDRRDPNLIYAYEREDGTVKKAATTRQAMEIFGPLTQTSRNQKASQILNPKHQILNNIKIRMFKYQNEGPTRF